MFYCTFLCSTVLYTVLLYCTLLCSNLLCSTLFYSSLFSSIILCCTIQDFSTLLHCTLLCSSLKYSVCYNLLCCTQLYSALLFSALLDCVLLCSALLLPPPRYFERWNQSWAQLAVFTVSQVVHRDLKPSTTVPTSSVCCLLGGSQGPKAQYHSTN